MTRYTISPKSSKCKEWMLKWKWISENTNKIKLNENRAVKAIDILNKFGGFTESIDFWVVAIDESCSRSGDWWRTVEMLKDLASSPCRQLNNK